MSPPGFAAIILAAGEGSRLNSARPKVLHEIAGQAMIRHVIAALRPLAPAETVVVIGRDMDAVAHAVAPLPTAIQFPPRGTGDAVRAARPVLADRLAGDSTISDLVVLYGDTPLISTETIAALLDARRRAPEAAVAVAGFRPADPGAYGRLVLDRDGGLARIVEAKDAGPEELAIRLCNGGIMAIDARHAFDLIDADRQRQRQARVLPDRYRRRSRSGGALPAASSNRPKRRCSASTPGRNWPPRRR